MDDGLTSMSGDTNGYVDLQLTVGPDDKYIYITFIGTGFGWTSAGTNLAGSDNYTVSVDGVALKTFTSGYVQSGSHVVVQNLPYGTHIVKFYRNAANSYNLTFKDFTFYQPKMPPIPDNACIIADYMLMADYVANTAYGNHLISKGVRTCSQSRDILYNEIHGFVASFYDAGAQPGMGYIASSSSSTNATNNKYSLPAFGTSFYVNGHTSQNKNDLFINDTDVAQSGTTTGNHGDISYPNASVELGMNKFAVHGASGESYSPYISGIGWKIVSPIHTSSHYQTFETPYLHELVGGDRNMEQNNLVVTADGKTWDEVTRDTSYMGPSTALVGTRNGGHVSSDNPCIFDECRGIQATKPCFNKNIAYGYDRFIILEEGLYRVQLGYYNNPQDNVVYILKNSTSDDVAYGTIGRADSPDDTTNIEAVWEMKRGDYIYTRVRHGGTNSMSGTNAGYTLMSIQKLN